jgi:hypothetical protein
MHNRIGRLLDFRFGHVFHTYVADSMKHYGLHEPSFLSIEVFSPERSRLIYPTGSN